MRLFYHHVGEKGALEDFPKTVYKRVPITVVNDSLAENIQAKGSLIATLEEEFPDGWFNCWGAPAGSETVFKKISVGDLVLLVESLSSEGGIPVLCEVCAVSKILLPTLSKQLWGNERFPYIFFFSTTTINYNWQELLKHVGYAPNYNPRGLFQSVREDKLLRMGWKSTDDFRNHLLKNHLAENKITYELVKSKVIKERANSYEVYVVDAKDVDSFLHLVESPPMLIDESQVEPKFVPVLPRDEAFRRIVRTIYGGRCAICQSTLISPHGLLEVQSAHIYPKAKRGSDDLRNGICLCRLHHWAFDVGWFSISDDLTVIVNDSLPNENGYDFILKYKGRKIAVPLDENLAPHPIFLIAHRNMHGFE